MSRHSEKVTLSQHRWERIRLMDGVTHGYMFTMSKYGLACTVAYRKGDYFYGSVISKTGIVSVRYHKDCHLDKWAFRVNDSYSPHSPF